MDNLTAYIKSREPKLHILVNNSGTTWARKYNDFLEKEGWDRVMDLNMKSLFYLTASLMPLLVKDSMNITPGRVINIASVAGISLHVEGELSDVGLGCICIMFQKHEYNILMGIFVFIILVLVQRCYSLDRHTSHQAHLK